VKKLSKTPDQPPPPELSGLDDLLHFRVDGARSAQKSALIRALGTLMFPDGLDLDVLLPPWANEAPVAPSEVNRFVDDAKALHERYRRWTKPPEGAESYPSNALETGVSLVVRLTNELLADFKDRSPRNPGTFTGDGHFSSAQFHQMTPRVGQLTSVLSGVNQLLAIINKIAPNDKGDLRALEEAAVHESERWNQDTRYWLFLRLWLNWKIGYGIPGSCITDEDANQGLFGGWRYVSWDDYLTSALFFFDTEHGFAFASSTAKGMWKREKVAVLKRLRDSLAPEDAEHRAHQDIRASLPAREIDSILARLMSLVPKVIADPESPDHLAQLLQHLQPTKRGRRNTELAAKRTPDDEEFFNQKITRIRPVKEWRCDSDYCTAIDDAARAKAVALDAARAAKDFAKADALHNELQSVGWIVETTKAGTTLRRAHPLDQTRIFDIDAEEQDRGCADTRESRSPRFKSGYRSAFDRFVCPEWWWCRGLLKPIFDDGVRT